jgi:hypothetical protein
MATTTTRELADADSHYSLGYAQGYEYFMRFGYWYRAPYENALDDNGYRDRAQRIDLRELPVLLSDRHGVAKPRWDR